MLTPPQAEVVCRLIAEEAVGEVVDCLQRGFPERPRVYWTRALERLARRPQIADYPRYGFALFTDERVVGVLLQIFSRVGEADNIRCNLSSWCVDEKYRGYAPLLHLTAVKRKEATYLNISPAAHTRQVIEAFGFRRFSNGQIVFAPFLSRPERNVRVRPFAADEPGAALLPESERRLLADHAAMGCRALICVKDGAAYPFVFQDRTIFRRLIPCPQLIYCRGMDEFIRFAGPIGRYLFFSHRAYLHRGCGGADAGVGRPLFSRTRTQIFQRADPAEAWRPLLYGNGRVRPMIERLKPSSPRTPAVVVSCWRPLPAPPPRRAGDPTGRSTGRFSTGRCRAREPRGHRRRRRRQ